MAKNPNAKPDDVALDVDAPVAGTRVSRWRVLEQRTIHLHGQMITLRVGDIFAEADYGPKAVQMFLDARVRAEPVIG